MIQSLPTHRTRTAAPAPAGRVLWVWIGAFVLLVIAACGSSNDDDAEPWGAEAERFFDALSEVHTANDFYGVLDFYAPTARVDKWRASLRGGATIADLIRWNSGDLDQEVLGVHLGREGALSLVRWTTTGEFSAVESSIDQGRISGETVFDLGETQRRSLRASPDVIDTYESIYASYAEAWTLRSPASLGVLYGSQASVEDSLLGIAVSGIEAIAGSASPGRQVAVIAASGTGSGSDGYPAVHLGPADYGTDPGSAVGVFEVTDGSGCAHQIAVSWLVEDGLIVQERRYHDVASFSACVPDAAEGWWTDLGLPVPSDQVVSGVLETPGGQEITVYNGTPLLESLVLGGLEQFRSAGLSEPKLDSVTFEPSRSCADRTGRVLQDTESRDMFLCLYESDLCPANPDCSSPAVSRRAAALHELGHVWMLDNLTDGGRDELMELAGKSTWRGGDVPWFDQGVEYAAEAMTWGLLEELIPMVRIGDPACDLLHRAFVLLTGQPPLRTAEDCPTA